MRKSLSVIFVFLFFITAYLFVATYALATNCSTTADSTGCGSASSGTYCEAWIGYNSSYGNGYCVPQGTNTVPYVDVYQMTSSGSWHFKYPQLGSYNNHCWKPSNCRVACTCSAGGSCSGSTWNYCEVYNNTCNVNKVPNFAVYACTSGTWQLQYTQSGTYNNGCYVNPNSCPVTVSITPTPTPTSHPTGTVTPTPPQVIQTTGDVTVHLEGIDQGNFQNDENIIPTKESQGSAKTRSLTLYFYAATAHPETDDPLFVETDTVTQITDTTNPLAGYFRQQNFKLPGVIKGTYIVLAKIQEGSLIQYLTGSTTPIQIYNQGGNNVLVNVDGVDLTADNLTYSPPTIAPTMKMGDIVTDCSSGSCDFNTVDAADYNALVDCYGAKITSDNCKAHNYPGDSNVEFNGKQYFVADLNGDGVIDGIDYNMLIKNFNSSGVTVNLGSTKIKASVPLQPTPVPAPQQSPTPTTSPTPTNPAPHGTLDDASCTNSIYGWACDASDYTQPISVDLYVDGQAGQGGQHLARITANSQRESAVSAQCGGFSNRGYTYPIPANLRDNTTHSVYAYAIDIPGGNNPLLTGSPKTFQCAPPSTPSPTP